MNKLIEQMMLDATKDMPHGYYVPPQYWEKFAELIVKKTISEISHQMFHHGIDESNNPRFYKAIDETEKSFGLACSRGDA